jgi:hypothetical protein
MRANAFGSADDKENELSKQIDAAVEAIERKLREKLSRPSTPPGNGTMKSKLPLDAIAIIVSIAAVLFTGLQWLEARHQRQLNAQANIGIDIDTDLTQRRLGISIHNAGPGVASLRSIAYYVDHKAVNDSEFDDALTAAHLNPEHEVGLILDPNEPLAVGETIWLIDYRARGKDEKARALDFIENHLAIGITHCSLDGPCKTECSTAGACQPAAVNNPPPAASLTPRKK